MAVASFCPALEQTEVGSPQEGQKELCGVSGALRSRGFELGDHLLLGLSWFILALDLRYAPVLGTVDSAACVYFYLYLFLFSLPHLGPPPAWHGARLSLK